ncbi:MAG: hypothetical protein FWC39_01060 [Bacteroidetes bacterium]|nr:hypothetical protein [Bacteroidota bacterium]
MRTNILKITALLVIIAGCISACNDPKPQPGGNENPEDTTQITDTTKIVCEFENPLTDLSWLKEKIEEFNLLIQENPNLSIAIYQCTYGNEEIGFLIDKGNTKPFYNCKGEVLCTMGGVAGETCSELNIVSQKLIWEKTQSCPCADALKGEKCITMRMIPEELFVNTPNKLVIENHSNKVLRYGKAYTLEYFDNGSWTEIQLDTHFSLIGLGLGACETAEEMSGVTPEQHILELGRYRIGKRFCLGNFPFEEVDSCFNLYAEYEIK